MTNPHIAITHSIACCTQRVGIVRKLRWGDEASGSALPGPLVWEIAKVSEIARVDGVVGLPVDAVLALLLVARRLLPRPPRHTGKSVGISGCGPDG